MFLSRSQDLMGEQVIVYHHGVILFLLLPVLRPDVSDLLAAQEGVCLLQNCVELTKFNFALLISIVCIYLPAIINNNNQQSLNDMSMASKQFS